MNYTLHTNVSNATGPLALDSPPEEDWFLVRLVSAFIEAIVEQSDSKLAHDSTWERLGGISTYCCSIYGLSCLVMALVLNRTLVMASTNTSRNQQNIINRNRGVIANPQSADLLKRLSIISLRIGVIMLLVYNCFNVLVALNLLGHIGIAGDHVPWFYSLIPDRYFRYDPDYFHNNKYMRTPKTQVLIGPTSDMYWPIFLNFCLSSFTETFIASIQGKKPYTESGITIFEHSLAFQEFSSGGAFFFGSRKHERRPTESLLLATLFSILNHLNIHVGGLINNNKYRLIPSTILGISFLGYFVSSFFDWKILQFPTILIMTFTPQVLVLSIIFISAAIFSGAIIANGFRLEDLNYASFFLYEGNGEDSDFSSRNFNVSLSDDFYTALLNIGVLAITSAGKSSYITELSLVTLDSETWLERSLWEKAKLAAKSLGKSSQTMDHQDLISYFKENGLTGYDNIIDKPSQRLITGSTIEEETQDPSDSRRMSVFKRRFVFTKEIVVDFSDLIYGLLTDKLMLSVIPKLFRKHVLRQEIKCTAPKSGPETAIEFGQRKRSVPPYLRKYAKRRGGSEFTEATKPANRIEEIDEDIEEKYLDLLNGELLPEVDTSEDFNVVYYSDSDYESETDVVEVIPSTPSQRGRIPLAAEEPQSLIALNELITPEEFSAMMSSSNFNILQHHLNRDNSGILTRARFNKLVRHSEGLASGVTGALVSADKDESLKLLELIVAKRAEKTKKKDEDDTFADRFDCVICQTNPREIITWPCKCFAICESCRLSLVSKGIEGCVCCRRDVEGVSKVFIP
ncbi:uncharacterized protein RJT20DRAFT_131293 [Scheffersomyces xylosifermentans]|uniref:uncharacterized protein n=1 Tax=Scheffersomyces xylosifermentans TaxID=1304137 RepID=UPI00315C6C16